jgi:hypothetical protein
LWVSPIFEQRRQIVLILTDSPSLRNYLTEVFAKCYSQARSEAVDETKLPIAPFPEQGSFAEVDVLAERWLS